MATTMRRDTHLCGLPPFILLQWIWRGGRCTHGSVYIQCQQWNLYCDRYTYATSGPSHYEPTDRELSMAEPYRAKPEIPDLVEARACWVEATSAAGDLIIGKNRQTYDRTVARSCPHCGGALMLRLRVDAEKIERITLTEEKA